MSGRDAGAAGIARRWWDGDLGAAGSVLNALLAPAEVGYRAAVALRNTAYDRALLHGARAELPVISVGNIAVGGSGKTPFTSWLARRLRDRGEQPAIVHGGYAADEPELHRTWTPDLRVIVDRDRVRAAATAHAAGASVVVLDDAFQHRRLRRDLDIVLVSVERWRMPQRLLPRGPWREPVSALERAGLIVCVRRTPVTAAALSLAADLRARTHRQVVHAHLQPAAWQRGDLFGSVAPDAGTASGAPDAGTPSGAPPSDAPRTPSLLVAGVAEPGLVEANARAAGAVIADRLTFRDHHAYGEHEVARIRSVAGGRPVLTTAKDWVKLRAWLDPAQTWILTQRVVLEDDTGVLDRALDQVLR